MANVIIRPSMDPARTATYERMIGTLLATMDGDVQQLAAFLTQVEATSTDRRKRDLARELIRYVSDRKFLVNRA